MIVNTLDYGLNPQASLDAPRWFWDDAAPGQGRAERWLPAIVEALRQTRATTWDVRLAQVGVCRSWTDDSGASRPASTWRGARPPPLMAVRSAINVRSRRLANERLLGIPLVKSGSSDC